jgi:hypothetical protein
MPPVRAIMFETNRTGRPFEFDGLLPSIELWHADIEHSHFGRQPTTPFDHVSAVKPPHRKLASAADPRELWTDFGGGSISDLLCDLAREESKAPRIQDGQHAVLRRDHVPNAKVG